MCLFSELPLSLLAQCIGLFLSLWAGAVWAPCLFGFIVDSRLLGSLAIRLSMEVRSGGGDRYGASWYSVPSAGAVCGVSSTELLVVLCGYLFVVWLFRVSVGLRVWPGQTVSALLWFLSCQVLSACASGQAELSVSLVPSCVIVVVSRRLVCLLICSWCCVGNSSSPLDTSGVFVSMSVSGPVALALVFTFGFLGFACSQ